MKKFFMLLCVCVVALLQVSGADAMPEGQGMIARYYPGWEAISRKESDFFKFTRDFMSDYEAYSEKYRVRIQQQIQDVYKITPFDQEQAKKEIGQLIDNKKTAKLSFGQGTIQI